ncbi:MAG TPA: GAF domain-containing SpoIIE family protein phosphatase [Chthoniobacteraceae bacterium]|nr:GAF domain-containing SpoIIE family protein phosphatase [Chthoniobacteraceae bacterium]
MSQENDTTLRALKMYKGLVEVSALINAITDFNELLTAILDVARRVTNSEAGSLFLVNADRNLELAIARASNAELPEGSRIVVPRGQGIAGWVLANRKSSLVVDAYADPRFYKEVDKKTGFRTRSILCVPLLHDHKEIGVLQVLNPLDKEAFDETDLEAFEAYGTLAATAIDKLQTIERQKQQARVDQELLFAREIQNSFLPQDLPEVPGLGFAATYRPALNIGGDFYDVLEIGPDEIYFVAGDVSGKGIPAALLMAQSLSTLRLIIKPDVAPDEALARWNEMLCGHSVRGMFITAILGRITPSRRLVEVASAGHCQPFRVAANGNATLLEVRNSPPLGIVGGLKYHVTSASLSPREWLVFYTDGLTESFSPGNIMLDTTGVQQLLSPNDFGSAVDIVNRLQTGEEEHRGTAAPHDDLTILALGFQ